MHMAYMDVKPATPTGRTVVVLHGRNFCAATWQGSIAALSEAGYRVIAPDQIGLCKSTKPTHYQYSLQQLAGNTHALLASLGINRATVMGHSMGGHGALTVALRHPGRYRAASAFAPIVAPSHVPWGIKALGGYLGNNKDAWRTHDTVALIEDGAKFKELLVDVGDADQFLTEQLRPELLQAACEKAGIPLTLRRQAGYDHSYYFISTFMGDHLRWHAERLKV